MCVAEAGIPVCVGTVACVEANTGVSSSALLAPTRFFVRQSLLLSPKLAVLSIVADQ